ncbi:MAG: hypothetical protein OXQ90_19240 [Gammaproteobacteria bacterium]|nr:hypothetical protein [Gammaproteobacteria bacterium]
MKMKVPDPGDRATLRRFDVLPARHSDIELRVRLRNGKWWPVHDAERAHALGLDVGDSVSAVVSFVERKKPRARDIHVFTVYATGDIAERVAFRIEKGAVVDAKVKTVHRVLRVRNRHDPDEGTLEQLADLVLTEILAIDGVPCGGKGGAVPPG